jgi:Fur family peroxide stress response transcriptional regulator
MVDVDARLNQALSKLKEEGYRLTPQRVAVVKMLVSSEEHPSVEMVYEKVKPDFPYTSLSTIYKIVHLLKNLGEVVELGFSEDNNRYDGIRPYPHPHLVCVQCKKIIDPDIPVLSKLPGKVGEKTGYHIITHRLDFFGVCPVCQKRKK